MAPNLPLEYARAAVVGAVTLETRSTGLMLTMAGSTPLFRGGVIGFALGAAVLSVAIVLRFTPLLVRSRRYSYIEVFWLVAALFGLGLIASGVRLIFASFHTRVLEIDSDETTLTWRDGRGIERDEWATRSLADLDVRRAMVEQTMGLGYVAIAILRDGSRVHLHYGTREECDFIRDTVAEALSRPREPWVERDWPGTRWISRVKLCADPEGARVHQPPRCSRLSVLLAAVLVPGATLLAAWIEHQNGRSWQRVWDDAYWPSLVGAFALIAAALGLMGEYHLRRATSVTIDCEGLTLEERSVFRPALEKWPLERISGFALSRTGGGRCAIDLQLSDGARVPLLAGLHPRDAAAVHAGLKIALSRACNPSIPPRITGA